jgi:hypothetical protein
VKIEEVPRDLRRRVAQRLESIRGTPMAPGADSARLGDSACPIYRPDVEGVAYWEIEIVGLKATRARDRKGRGGAAGFVLASAGRHDVPLSHWSLTIEPPSRALEAKATTGPVARIVKLDTLAYVAEDEKGSYLAHVGQFPPRIVATGVDSAALRGISTVTAVPGKPSDNDDAPGEPTISKGGDPVPAITLGEWRSWDDAKSRFAATYKPQLASLAARAAPAWAIEDLVAKFGEGIREGQKITVALLGRGKAQVVGAGANAVKMALLERDPPAVVLQAVAYGGQSEATLQLDISYEDGTAELLTFFVVPKGAPSNFRSGFPNN